MRSQRGASSACRTAGSWKSETWLVAPRSKLLPSTKDWAAESPHLLAPKIKAKMYFGVASNDDKTQPDAKVKLKEAFEAANNPAEIEVYSDALHGWCVRDMPLSDGKPIYNKPDAERAWGKLVVLYKTALA